MFRIFPDRSETMSLISCLQYVNLRASCLPPMISPSLRRPQMPPMDADREVGLFCFKPVANELIYSHHRQAILRAEPCQIRAARHTAIAVHDFADHFGMMQPCQSCEVN